MISFKIGKTRLSIGRPRQKSQGQQAVRGRYDAAQTTAMNSKWWANADSFSADEANNPQVRQVVRDRFRYEDANNAYIHGMKNTFAESVIGTGGRLEFLDPNPAVNDAVEQAFMDWSEGIGLPDLMLTQFKATAGDGESFMKETQNVNPQSPVQLDYELVETELCSSGEFSNSPTNIDGVLLGENGKPVGYTFLKDHPGGQTASFSIDPNDVTTLRADQVIHLFQKERPGQHRGMSEFASALEVGYKFRDYVLSTVDAARIASKYTGVLHTSSVESFDDEDSESGDGEFKPFENVPVENGMMLTLPEGYDLTQFKPEQPTANFKDFKEEGVKEEGRAIGMPGIVALGTAAGANFASGRLDHLKYGKTIKIRQANIKRVVLHPIFMKFFREARVIDGLLPREVVGPGYTPRFTWFFDGDGAIDPSKEATAREKNLKSKSTTHAEVFAEKGMDWKKGFDQMAKEQKYAKSIGLDLTQEAAAPDTGAPAAEAQAEAIREMVEDIIEEQMQEQS